MFGQEQTRLSDQIKCIERELDRRKKIYPKYIKNKTMDDKIAAKEIREMEAVLATLKKLSNLVYTLR